MKILVKESEYRCQPEGHVFSAEINSVEEVLKLIYLFTETEGKRASEAFFKLVDEKEWLGYEEFIWKYFLDGLEIPKTEYIGFEEYVKTEEDLRREAERAEWSTRRLDENIADIFKGMPEF